MRGLAGKGVFVRIVLGFGGIIDTVSNHLGDKESILETNVYRATAPQHHPFNCWQNGLLN